MWPFRPKRKPGRPPSYVYRSIAKRHHTVRCCVRGCKVTNPRLLDVHHKDENPWNNRPSNLEWRCRQHHLAAHGKQLRYHPPGIRSLAQVYYVDVPHTGGYRHGCCLGTLFNIGAWVVLIGALVVIAGLL